MAKKKSEPVIKENLLEVINELAKEKGIERETLIRLVEEAVVTAARKKLRKYETLEAHLNQKTGFMELFQYKTVMADPEDPENEISIEVAREMDESAEEGDEVEYEVDPKEFNRIAQSARQLIFKKLKEAEREMVFNSFKERKGEILTGTVVRTEPGGRIAINFNRTEAYLFRQEQIPGDQYSHNDHIRVYLMDVSNDPQKISQLAISRTHPGFLIKLFEMEVPEVYDGVVEIIAAAREPGKRAKVAVYTADAEVDPVGACVGMRGSRVQAIVNELRGEKIDIVRWNADLSLYVQNALAPAEVVRMEIDDDRREINAWVDQDQLSLAIGRQGQNVRLASKLVGCKINVSAIAERTTSSIDEELARALGKVSRPVEEAPVMEVTATDAIPPSEDTPTAVVDSLIPTVPNSPVESTTSVESSPAASVGELTAVSAPSISDNETFSGAPTH